MLCRLCLRLPSEDEGRQWQTYLTPPANLPYGSAIGALRQSHRCSPTFWNVPFRMPECARRHPFPACQGQPGGPSVYLFRLLAACRALFGVSAECRKLAKNHDKRVRLPPSCAVAGVDNDRNKAIQEAGRIWPP